MHFKEIIRLKFPNKQPIRFNDDTYEGIVWNPLDNSPNPTLAELEAAEDTLLPHFSGNSQTVLVTNFISGESTDNVVIIPSAIFVNNFLAVTVPPMSGTSIIPLDNTAPLATEGTKLAEIALTPKAVSSKFRCSFTGTVDSSASSRSIIFTLFSNGVCIGSVTSFVSSAGRTNNMSIDVVDLPATTGPVVYTLRVGTNNSATWYVNRSSAGVILGGFAASPFTVTEFE